jgi:hypothetical protein
LLGVAVKAMGWIVTIMPKNGRLWERSTFPQRRSRTTREIQVLEATSRKWESWCARASDATNDCNVVRHLPFNLDTLAGQVHCLRVGWHPLLFFALFLRF